MNWRPLQAVSQPTDTEGLRYIPHTPHAFVLTRIGAVGRRVVKRSLLHHAQTRRRFKRSHLARHFERGELGSHLGLHVEKRQVDYRMAMTCRRMVLVHPDKSRRVQKYGISLDLWGSVEKTRGGTKTEPFENSTNLTSSPEDANLCCHACGCCGGGTCRLSRGAVMLSTETWL
jgi:hypothetical protein